MARPINFAGSIQVAFWGVVCVDYSIGVSVNGLGETYPIDDPTFQFNEAISFVIDCLDQAEVDYYWDRLTADGGDESMCGWLKDRFGVSWQVVPRRFNELVSDDDQEKAGRVMQAMLKMKKLDIAALEKAFEG